MDQNSVLVVFNIVNEWGAMVINCPNCWLGTKVWMFIDDFYMYPILQMFADSFYWLNYDMLF